MILAWAMDAGAFAKAVVSMGLSKSDVARLLGVTVRAVDFWSSGSREIPGPVAAYLRLLGSLPPAIRAQELARLKENPMKVDGMYVVEFVGREGQGLAILTLMDGVVFGHDGGVVYDGTYAPSKRPDHVDLTLRLTVPAGVSLVTGIPEQPADYWFDLQTTILARGTSQKLSVKTPYGLVVCDVRFLRALPAQLAA